ncbi:S8 family serine peptidase [Deinococcus ruber]|uniref:Serine protease n=1 Tax=Deinococcus ruber TaxID=1848197 RepID=A0A918FFS8_9DEIO|nr:S8 family serine peptidase [Deinococcus ruber]GGR35218.1 serine protease [Deinococcus ruber]
MHARTHLFLSLTALLLAACNSTTSGPAADLSADRPGQVATRYAYAALVPLQPGDSVASLQHATGGTVVTWNDATCRAGSGDPCQAIVGINAPTGTTAAQLSALSVPLNRDITVEANKDQFTGGGTLTATIGGARVAWAGGSLLAWSGGARVAWAGGSYAPIPQNTQLWTTLHLQQAQALAPNLGAGVTVAVIDTGIDLNHPAFAGSLTDPATWQDYYAGDTVPQDEGTLGTGGFGHGTNVAGIILQIAPRARIMPIRVLGPDGSGDLTTIAQAITWAVAKGANVINLSLGSTSDSKIIQQAITAATAKGVLVVSSAGNANEDKITYPAASATKIFGLLSVGSVDLTDTKSSFSNYAKELELMAPGENVYAPAPGNLMAAWSGTSQAAPIVAGGLALALGQPLKVPVSNITTSMAATAVNLYTNPLNQRYDKKLGYGRLDLAAFLTPIVK